MLYRVPVPLSILLALVLTTPPHPAAAHDGARHLWGPERCGPWQTVGRCRQRTCLSECTYPGCSAVLPRSESECAALPPPIDAVPVGTPWGPRPGSGAGAEEHRHDWGPEECAGWSEIRRGCKIRHCCRHCRTCHTTGESRFDQDPPGCW